MGRSQVARNQRHGRPGSGREGRGRGGIDRGGRGKEDKHPKHQQHNNVPLEGNSFRYEKYQEYSHQDDDDDDDDEQGHEHVDVDWDHLAIGEQYKYIPRTLKSPLVRVENEEQIDIAHDNEEGQQSSQYTLSLDIPKLASCLENMESSTWMRLSDDLTMRYDDRIGGKSKHNNNTGNQKMTIAEMAACPFLKDVVVPVPVLEDQIEQNVAVAVEVEVEVEDSSENSSEDGSNNSEDEDLDAWLDTVIET
jgi:hypothetical protein